MELATILRDERIDAQTFGPVVGWEENGVVQLRLPGDRAYEVWRRLRGRVSETGYWPIITDAEYPEWLTGAVTGDDEEQQSYSVAVSRRKSLQQAEQLTFERWLEQQRDPSYRAAEYLRLADHCGKLGGEDMAKLYRGFAEEYRTAPPWIFDPSKYAWPDEAPEVLPAGHWITLLTTDGKRAIIDRAAIVFVPTTSSWEAPAYLDFGGFNACPAPQVHVAMLRWVHERYGGQLVAMGHGTIEVLVTRRPASRDEALRLAADMQTYAEEFLGAGHQTEIIARYLVESAQWGFWWD